MFVPRDSVGMDFQEELSDMLLLKMLRSATQASEDKDRVCVGNLDSCLCKHWGFRKNRFTWVIYLNHLNVIHLKTIRDSLQTAEGSWRYSFF